MENSLKDKVHCTIFTSGKSANGTSGFTLIELLVGVAIVGILSAIAVPSFQDYKASARDARRITTSRNVFTALEGFYIDNQEYPPNPTSGRACSPQDGHGFYSLECLVEIYPFFSEEGLKQDLGSSEFGAENNLYYYNYGAATQGAVVYVRLEHMKKENPCVFPTGGWCSNSNGSTYCLCTGEGVP